MSQSNRARLFAMVLQGSQQNETREIHELLQRLNESPESPAFVKALVGKLVAVLAGDRNADLAADNELEYLDAAELLLLLEHLKSQ